MNCKKNIPVVTTGNHKRILIKNPTVDYFKRN